MASEKVAGVGTVEVYDRATGSGGAPELLEVYVLIDADGRRVAGKIADFQGGGAAGHYDEAHRETPKIQAFTEYTVDHYRRVAHAGVGLLLDVTIERTADDGAKVHHTLQQQKIAVTCGNADVESGRQWQCRTVSFNGFHDRCTLDRWSPPGIDYTCSGGLVFSALK